jgi:hypothetical protein
MNGYVIPLEKVWDDRGRRPVIPGQSTQSSHRLARRDVGLGESPPVVKSSRTARIHLRTVGNSSNNTTINEFRTRRGPLWSSRCDARWRSNASTPPTCAASWLPVPARDRPARPADGPGTGSTHRADPILDAGS